MTDITLSQADISAAETFLEDFLSNSITEGDFTKGSSLRDLTIGALALIFSLLQKENETTRAGQSLLLLEALEDDVDTTEMVDQILSNWFLTRRTGLFNTGPLVLHFSEAVDVVISSGVRFFKTSTQIYVLNAGGGDLTAAASSLVPTFDADGVLVDYTLTIPVKATTIDDTVITPGRWLSADTFNIAFTYAENEEDFNSGTLSETNAEFIGRSRDAISTRNLINGRSIRATLVELFNSLKQVLALGMGDPEMRRDLIDRVGQASAMHVGGHNDIYVDLPVITVEETLTVGGEFDRPDGLISVFKDSGVPDFVAAGVEPGHILNLISGTVDAPRQYIITGVEPGYIEISPRFPFTEVTAGTGLFSVDYSIGELSPAYSDVIAPTTTTDGTSDAVSSSGRVTLSGRPVLSKTIFER